LVGEGVELEEFDRFLEAARQAAVSVSEIYQKMYCGYDDLVACEIAFFKNQPDMVKKYANQAILKARETNQHSIEEMAAQYLFRIAMQEGDYPIIKNILEQGRGRSDNPEFGGRQMLYEFFTSLLYAQIGSAKTVPLWSVSDENESADEVHVPTKELIIGVKYYFAAKKYHRALMLLSNSIPKNPQEKFLFGELSIVLLTAIAKIKTDDNSGAVRDFEKAYSLSFNGIFEMPFIERGTELHSLVVAALNQSDCNIPKEWLKKIDRKASIYTKKAAVVLNAFKRDKNIKDSAQLSPREREVLDDLYHGLSREEIATNRYLSINTVHKIIQSIYIKLDAYNNVDAIRIAMDKNLLE
jgi:DNA-binding CsgD family transcriptional regulator